MRRKVIRLCALLLAVITLLAPGAAALDYGQEWAGANTTATNNYNDVPPTHWAWDSIQRVSAKNWFSGYPDGTFRPNGTITRAEALKVFVVFLGLEVAPVTQTSFYDVATNAWYAPYVEAGKDLFPVHTTVQGKTPFQPDMPVTREDTVYALVNALGYGNNTAVVDESVLNMFADQNSISRNLRPYFAVALQKQLVAGYNDNTIRAQNSLTRAEFATLLYRGSFVGHNDSYSAKISTVSLSSSSAELTIGDSATISARATYTDGTNQAYSDIQAYIASGSDVISLNGTTVTALKQGTATIGFNDSYLKGQSLTVTVKAPTAAPVIKITDYAATTENDTVSIIGTVSDANLSTVSLVCNGKDIIPSANGSFQTTVALNAGTNTITFTATNQYGATAQKTITVTRTEPLQQESPNTQDNVQQSNQQNSNTQNNTQQNTQGNQQNNTAQDNTQQNTQPATTNAIDLTTQDVQTTSKSWIIKEVSELTVQVGEGKNATYSTYKSGLVYAWSAHFSSDGYRMYFSTGGKNTLTFTAWVDSAVTISVYSEDKLIDKFTLGKGEIKTRTLDISDYEQVAFSAADYVKSGTLKIFEPTVYDR